MNKFLKKLLVFISILAFGMNIHAEELNISFVEEDSIEQLNLPTMLVNNPLIQKLDQVDYIQNLNFVEVAAEKTSYNLILNSLNDFKKNKKFNDLSEEQKANFDNIIKLVSSKCEILDTRTNELYLKESLINKFRTCLHDK